MFTTKSEFDLTALKLLLNIQKGNFYTDKFDFELSTEKFNYMIRELDNLLVLDGYKFVRMTNNSGYKASRPRITTGGLDYIDMIISNNLLLPLSRKVSSEGLNSSYNRSQVEEMLDIKVSSIKLYLEKLEHNHIIKLDSKFSADNDELYSFELKLTPEGYNQFSGTEFFKPQQAINVDNSIHQTFNDSTIFQGNIQISDSFKQEVNSSRLSDEDKAELIEIVTSLVNERQLSEPNESKLKRFVGSIASKLGDAAAAESVAMLVRELTNLLN